MKRRWLSVIGIFFLLTGIGLALTVAYLGGLSALQAANGGLLALVGVLFVLAGEGRSIGPIQWYQLAGLADICLGGWFVLQVVDTMRLDPGGTEWVMIISFIVAGAVFAFIGIDWFRGGKHYDLSSLEAGPLRGD